MSKHINSPVHTDRASGTLVQMIGANNERVFATDELTQGEMQDLIDAVNGKDAASLFFDELLMDVDTLTGIADQYGARTLADVMYLQNAILKGGFIELFPSESKILEVVKNLPSLSKWLEYIRLPSNS